MSITGMMMSMESYLIAGALAVVGSLFGSFACAMVWRLRAQQLDEDKAHREVYDKAEYRRLKGLLGESLQSDRSRCLSCGHILAWYDLLPIVSWLALRGKCRYCSTPIGRTELYAEVGLGAVFAVSFLLWPYPLDAVSEIVRLGIWYVALIGLCILFIYDAKWFLLPDKVTYPLVVLGVLYEVVVVWGGSMDTATVVFQAVSSVAAIGGLYGILYVISAGRWVGFGDVKLGVVLGLFLLDWKLALLTVFAANVFGCVLVMPQIVRRAVGRGTQVPFGPLLIAGWLFASLVGGAVIAWYLHAVIGMPA